MISTDKGKKYALIAAICYLIIATYEIIYRINIVRNYDFASITALNILFWIILISFAVALFIKKTKALIFVAGADAMLNIYYLISYFTLPNLFTFIASGILVFILVLSLNGNDIVKKLWFIPGLARIFSNIIIWISYEYFSHISIAWKFILLDIINAAALIFIGLWLEGKDTAAPTNDYSTFNPYAVSDFSTSNNIIGGADKLKIYKELLDSGTITQEEFDAKKKQILGL